MKAEEYIVRGDQYYKEERYEAAIREFTAALAAFGMFAKKHEKALVYFKRAHAYRKHGDRVNAIGDLTQALVFYKNNVTELASTHFNRGNLYYELGDYESAVTDYSAASELYSDDNQKVNALVNRGNAYLSLNKPTDAIADYTAATQLGADNDHLGKAYAGRAFVLHKNGETAAAITDLNLALSLITDMVFISTAYSNRGIAHFAQGQHLEAISDFTAALIPELKDSDKADILFKRGNVYHASADVSAALEDYSQAFLLRPKLAKKLTSSPSKSFYIELLHKRSYLAYCAIKDYLPLRTRLNLCYTGEAEALYTDRSSSFQLMNCPVILPCCEQTIDRETLPRLKKSCPFCRKPLQDAYLKQPTINRFAQEILKRYVEEKEAQAEQLRCQKFKENDLIEQKVLVEHKEPRAHSNLVRQRPAQLTSPHRRRLLEQQAHLLWKVEERARLAKSNKQEPPPLPSIKR